MKRRSSCCLGVLSLFLGMLFTGVPQKAIGATPAGFPTEGGPVPSLSSSSSTPSDSRLAVVPLSPDLWPGESFSSAHNPFFPTNVPLSEWSRLFVHHGIGDDFSPGPIVSGGRVFVVSTFGRIDAMEAVSGRLLWHERVEGEVHAPMISSKRTLYVVTSSPSVTIDHLLLYSRTRRLVRGNGQERFWALSQRSGRILWSVALPASVLGSPLLEAHTIALASGSGHLLFLSRIDGHIVVDLPVAEGSFGWSSPLDEPSGIIVAQENPPMIDRVGKSPLETSWRFALSRTLSYDRFLIGTPVGTPTGIAGIVREKETGRMVLFQIDEQTGRLGWTLTLSPTSPEPSPDEMMMPVSSDGILYVPSPDTGEIVAVAPDGQLLWKTRVGEHPRTGGTAAGRLLIVPLPSGKIVALDRKSGTQVGAVVGNGPLGPRPLPVVGSVIFSATRSGGVRATDISVWGGKAEGLFRMPFSDVTKTVRDVVSGGPG